MIYLRNNQFLDVIESLFTDHGDTQLDTELNQATSRITLKTKNNCG
jgi:hypothetical protein